MAAAPSEIIIERLSAYLGPHTARNAVKTFAVRTFGVPPEKVTTSEAGRLLDALRPMLKTLLGAPQSTAVIEEINALLSRR